MQPLPIDALLPRIVEHLRRGPAVVVEAPPGAGKTTRVPRALLEAALPGDGEVLVLEPRRIAARMAARRVAEEMGEAVGETVGYQVRFEEVAGPRTRLRYITEGLLARRLVSEPALPGVGAVVLDEFHERHRHADLALAVLRRLTGSVRPDLKIVVMSATLDAGAAAEYLDAPILRADGRLHEVAVEHLAAADAADPRERLEDRVARAVRRLLADRNEGDILVFLPGMSEIRRAMEACAAAASRAGVDLLPLHGDLPPADQDRAVRPGGRRKAIFSTNVAETSVTIEGVTDVVDSGLARVASHDPWSGLPLLEVRKISRASAAQRAGRAGRVRPGRVLRLYTRHDHDMRPAFDRPEILRADLSEILLLLAALGIPDIEWLDAPPEAAVSAGMRLLRRLGALDGANAATPLGLRMLRFPAHPRIARFLVEAATRGAGREGALAAALLAERDIREGAGPGGVPGGTPTGSSDLLELAALFDEAARARFKPERIRSLGLSPAAVAAVDRGRRQFLALLRDPVADHPIPPSAAGSGDAGNAAHDEAIRIATLAAFPDRVARRRAAGSGEVVFAGGGSGRLDAGCVVREAPILVAVEAGERRGDRPGAPARRGGSTGTVYVRRASAATPEMLAGLFADRLRRVDELVWNDAAERVERWERRIYEDLVIDERRRSDVDPSDAGRLLAEAAASRGRAAFDPEGRIDLLLARMGFAGRTFPESGIVPFGDAEIDAALRALCAGRRSFGEIRKAGLEDALLRKLSPATRGFLDRMAPERIALRGGRSLKVRYGKEGESPSVDVRIQDLFGTTVAPAIAGGRVPLAVHILAPSMRPVQVTTDLPGFWARHYPSLRRELSRRYPKHSWPEDPLTARPPGK